MAKPLTPAEEAFLAFDWAASQSWQQYYNNLYPTPPLNKLGKYKRAWFRRNVDSNLPMDSTVGDPEPSKTTSTVNSAMESNNKSRQTQCGPSAGTNVPREGIVSEKLMTELDIALRIVYLVSTLATMLFRHVRFLPIGVSVLISQLSGLSFFLFLVIAIIKDNPPRWSMQWVRRIITDDNMQYLSYGVAVLGLPKTGVCAGPQLITCVIGLNRLYKQRRHLFPHIMKTPNATNIFNLIDRNSGSLLNSRAILEIATLVHILMAMTVGGASFLNVILYISFIKLKLKIRDIHLLAVLRQIDEFIISILSSTIVPSYALTIYSKLVRYMTQYFNPTRY